MNLFWTDQAAESSDLRRHFGFSAILTATFLILFVSGVNAQSIPPLERVVTISFYQEKLDIVLSRLAKEGKFTFSYNPAILDLNGTVSGSFIKKSIREILSQVFNGKIQLKQKNNYIILTKSSTTQSNAAVEALVITGYIINGETDEKIAEVSIYDRKTFAAAVSNEFGFFKLKIENPSTENQISINKKNYKDTLVMVSSGGEKFINFILTPERILPTATVEENFVNPDSTTAHVAQTLPEEIQPEPEFKTDEEKEKEKIVIKARRWIKSKISEINMRNIQDSLHRKFQVSYLPFLGTNHTLSGNVINDYSLNILGGYSLGTEIAEVGGIFNIDRGDVRQVQVAGIFNAVGGKMSGVQVAGVINMNNKEVVATQIAGNINFNLSSIKGLQVAGIMNMNGAESKGLQVAGLGNIQVYNYAGSQIAGLFNVTTHTITGMQVSGMLNIAKKVKGSQIGFINVADTIHGVPVGFISLVRQGYHKIEISADEIFYTNLAFRTGVHRFYNIFAAGIKPDTFGDPVWTIGYGVGSSPRLTKWLSLNFDVTSNHIERGHFTEAVSLLNKLYIGVDIHVAKKFSVTMGTTLNGYVSDRDYPDYQSIFTHYSPHLISNRDTGDNLHWQMWWGAKVGVRFL